MLVIGPAPTAAYAFLALMIALTSSTDRTTPLWTVVPTTVVFPHAQLFAGLVAVGEVAVGTCLILGLGTRVAAVVGRVLGLDALVTSKMPRSSRDKHENRTRGATPTRL